MKHTSLSEFNQSFTILVTALQTHFSSIDQNDPEQVKLANEYYKWAALKTRLILNEKSFRIPASAAFLHILYRLQNRLTTQALYVSMML